MQPVISIDLGVYCAIDTPIGFVCLMAKDDKTWIAVEGSELYNIFLGACY